MKKFILAIISFLFVYSVQAQIYEVGAGVGVLHYKGTVTPRFKPFMVKPGANLFFRYNVSRAVSFKAGGLIGNFYGDDKKVNDPFQQARGYSFSSSVKEGYAQIEYNFLNFRTNASRITSEWTPYVFGGLAYTLINPVSYNSITNQVNSVNKVSSTVIPFGIGFKKKWNANWNWGIEFGTRKTFNDDLDNLGSYYDPTITSTPATPPNLNDPTVFKNAKLLQGNRPLKDMYYYTSISISYVFYKISCPNPRN